MIEDNTSGSVSDGTGDSLSTAYVSGSDGGEKISDKVVERRMRHRITPVH